MIGIINYGAGNIYSLQCALDRVGAAYALLNTVSEFDRFDKYIIPGVGHAAPAMEKLKNTGLIPLIKATNKPVLGVCLGMQLLSSFSEEGDTALLDLVHLTTKRFVSSTLKIPQMGWNTVAFEETGNELFKGISNNDYFYFVHSYFVECNKEFTIGTTQYAQTFSAAIKKANFYGVQFHPEKSGLAGEQLLRNFIGL